MPTRNVIAPTIALLLMLSMVVPPLSADCTPWGENTQRGDAIYPEGWITSYSLIEITPPDEFIYAIIDGAQAVQQFSYLKAKLRNRILDHAMGPGTVTAYARAFGVPV
jgi:hypothetical protein